VNVNENYICEQCTVVIDTRSSPKYTFGSLITVPKRCDTPFVQHIDTIVSQFFTQLSKRSVLLRNDMIIIRQDDDLIPAKYSTTEFVDRVSEQPRVSINQTILTTTVLSYFTMNSNLAQPISTTSSQEQEVTRILEMIVNYKCRNCYCEYYTSSVENFFFHALRAKTLNQSESQVLFHLME
jgi:hypothetical protein